MASGYEKETGGIHDGHRERMKEKFRKSGFENMHPHEILEMLLYYSVPRKDTNPLAHKLIDRFGSLAGVFEATEEELCKIDGISQNSATLIKMILPLYRAYKGEKVSAKRISTSDESGPFLIEYYAGLTTERVTVLCIDGSCRVLGFETVCDGDAFNVMINFRKLMEIVLKYPMTTAVIVAHNHPGGLALPSREDISATAELRKTLGSMGISLVDHLIVSDNDYISMASSANFKHLFSE